MNTISTNGPPSFNYPTSELDKQLLSQYQSKIKVRAEKDHGVLEFEGREFIVNVASTPDHLLDNQAAWLEVATRIAVMLAKKRLFEQGPDFHGAQITNRHIVPLDKDGRIVEPKEQDFHEFTTDNTQPAISYLNNKSHIYSTRDDYERLIKALRSSPDPHLSIVPDLPLPSTLKRIHPPSVHTTPNIQDDSLDPSSLSTIPQTHKEIENSLALSKKGEEPSNPSPPILIDAGLLKHMAKDQDAYNHLLNAFARQNEALMKQLLKDQANSKGPTDFSTNQALTVTHSHYFNFKLNGQDMIISQEDLKKVLEAIEKARAEKIEEGRERVVEVPNEEISNQSNTEPSTRKTATERIAYGFASFYSFFFNRSDPRFAANYQQNLTQDARHANDSSSLNTWETSSDILFMLMC